MTSAWNGNAVVIHGGGPTPVLNASLAGLITEAREHACIRALWGARHGVNGALRADFIDLFAQPNHVLAALRESPGSAIGSSRMHLRDEHYEQLTQVLVQHNVRYVFVTGGNGTQDMGMRIAQSAGARQHEIRVVGIPKTIDNDLAHTYFTPGYPSAARFFAHALRDIGEDNRSLPSPINVVEVLGRNVGWVVGATALARTREDDPPHLIYFPERRLKEEQLLEDVEAVYRRLGRCVVAICEGQRNELDEPFGAVADNAGSARDRLASNLGHQVAQMLTHRLGVRARSEKPGLLGRASALTVAPIDREASWSCGRQAVRDAVSGVHGHMVSILPIGGPGAPIGHGCVPFADLAMDEHKVVESWITHDARTVSGAFLDYVRPLVGEIAGHPRLVG